VTRDPAGTNRGLRLLALCAVAIGLILLAAAAFVLSYAGVHAVALSAGVSPRLARLYPLILDAMVVVAGAAVLSLRGAGLPSRWYAWLSLLVMLAADAGADTLHAIGTRLPHKQSAAAAAIIPWALLLIGFSLLLAMLRHARVRARREPEVAVPEARPVPETHVVLKTDVVDFEIEGDTGPDGNSEPTDETDADDQAEADDDLAPENETGADIEDQGEDGAPSGTEPGAPESESGPVMEAAGFERVRSTPLPPGE
jgi:Protein of unknown function (DUF2637)